MTMTGKTGMLLIMAASLATAKAQQVTTPAPDCSLLIAETKTMNVCKRDQGEGFVIVAKKEYGGKVMAYNETAFNADSLPCGLRWWMDAMDEALEHIATQGIPAQTASSHRAAQGYSPVEDFLETEWGQDRPYNGKCPTINGSPTKTGCMATAMAQVMRYYHWPQQGTGQGSYYVVNGTQAYYYTEPVNSIYSWGLMDYKNFAGAPDEADDAVATLMYDCGKAVNTLYSVYASAAAERDQLKGMTDHFQYDKNTMRFCERKNYSSDQWLQMVYSELQARRPIFYSGYLPNEVSGHAFLLSGLDSEGRVYVNWGQDGRYNNYFSIDEIVMAGIDLTHAQTMIIGVKPAGQTTDIVVPHRTTCDMGDGESVPTAYYRMDGTKSTSLRRGVNIVKQGDRVVKLVR